MTALTEDDSMYQLKISRRVRKRRRVNFYCCLSFVSQ